jgi:crotonobetainyl-CoA:carnitine CoA-transferase CaiB-like acyl-CoA transferase
MQETPDYLQLPGSAQAALGVRESAVWPPAAPLRLDQMKHPPSYAAHTDVVLREVLGKNPEQIRELIATGIAEQA